MTTPTAPTDEPLGSPGDSLPDDGRTAFWRRVEEPLQRVRKFLYDLNARLTYFPREILAIYEVPGFGELTGLRQTDYRLEFPPGGRKHPLSMHFVCRGEREVVRQVVGVRPAIAQQADYLRRHGLTFNFAEVFADAAAVGSAGDGLGHVAFHLAPLVPVSLAFDTDPGAGGLRLHVWNLERLGRVSYPLEPEAVDDALLGEVEKAILRQTNKLNALAGFQIPDDVRSRLQQRLYLDARRKTIELKAGRERSNRAGFITLLLGRSGRER